MSIGRRLFDMARAELNSLLDRAVEAEGEQNDDPDEDLYHRFSVDQLSDAELEAEIERRYRARQAARGATSAPRPGPNPRASGERTAGGRRPGSARAHTTPADEELRRAYAALEVPFGADFATVRRSYRALMRKYHPDRHAASPDKQKTATELAQKLTAAYKLVEQRTQPVGRRQT
jgi:DnaJ-domain-containing protein 1